MKERIGTEREYNKEKNAIPQSLSVINYVRLSWFGCFNCMVVVVMVVMVVVVTQVFLSVVHDSVE